MLDSDTLSGFLFYLCFVSPVLAYVLTPGRFGRSKALKLSLGFLALICLLTLGVKMMEQRTSPNFYRLLQVNRGATIAELKRAYRVQSVLTHPDKMPEADKIKATEAFNRLRFAFDIVSDTDKSKIYDLYGEEGVADDSYLDQSRMDAFSQLLTYYLVWFVVSYFLTLGKDSGNSRGWMFSVYILAFVFELNLVMGTLKLNTSWLIFNQMTPHEVIELLRTALPVFLNSCRSIGSFLHNNLQSDNFGISVQLLRNNSYLLMKIKELLVEVQGLQRKRGTSTPLVVTTTEETNATLTRRSKLEKSPITPEGSPVSKTGTKSSDAEFDKKMSKNVLMRPSAKIQSPTGPVIPVALLGLIACVAYQYFV